MLLIPNPVPQGAYYPIEIRSSFPVLTCLHLASPPAASASTDYRQPPPQQDHAQPSANDDGEKRKPGRPRGSRNRKPRASTGSATKAPANTQHPGFYQYPPAPGANMSQQNQQFYEFQWRALNLCSEFYNAAEELIVSATAFAIRATLRNAVGVHRKPRHPWSSRNVTKWAPRRKLILSC